MDRHELEAWLRLQCTPGVGPRTARVLLARWGLPQHIFERSLSELSDMVGTKVAHALVARPADLEAVVHTHGQWLAHEEACNRCLTLGDPDYPQTLLHLEDPPLMLWATAAANLWEHGGINAVTPRSIAVVGSRNPTPQGLENARMFSAELAQSGFCIVSGMALGIDAAAHEGALEGAATSEARTIAVVGTGLDRVYPRQHHALAHQIRQRGYILSEYLLGTPPLSANFPRRNRILCGLARGTLVVEAALLSGSLITAQQTVEQGKDVFAIPGSIHSPQSRGCHKLIKEGAKLVESAQDVLDELDWSATSGSHRSMHDSAQSPAAESDIEGSLSPHERSLLEAMGFEPTGLDALQARSGFDTATLQVHLLTLELSGAARRLPGGLFQRVIQA